MLQIHKASAGSGKTYTLTRQYLKLLLGEKITAGSRKGKYRLRPLGSYGYGKPKAHGSILAVTFTNKATEEMTERIINELAVLAGRVPGRRSAYEAEFLKEFDTDPGTLAAHALRALQDLLFNFSWFNVSTIDSFFQGVLNTFTRELDLSPTHGLELDDRYPLEVAVGEMLSSIRVDYGSRGDKKRENDRRMLMNWLERYLANLAQTGAGFNLFSKGSGLFNDLVDSVKLFMSEKYRMNAEIINTYLSDHERIVKFARAISSGNEVLEALRTQAVDSARRLLDTADPLFKANAVKALTNIAEGNTELLTDTFRSNLDNPMYIFKTPTKKNPLNESNVGLAGEVFEALRTYLVKSDLYAALRKWVYYLGLFGHVLQSLDEFRRDNDTLLLSDTNDLLHRIIAEDETPFIYERMGTAIHHYLIDEFQDTSLMQWENLRPLVLESLSHNRDNLIIGDEKQCIYRFRNSDPRLLGDKVETLVRSRFSDAIDLRGVRIEENCNWRSAPRVVMFNNSVFAAMAAIVSGGLGNDSVARTYSALVQMYPDSHADMPGYVKAYFIPPDTGSGSATPYGDETRQEDECFDDRYPQELRLLKEEISRQLSAGYRPKDIAVLVRTVKAGRMIISYLMDVMDNDPGWRHGHLQLMSADSMSVGMSPAVKLIVNVLRLLNEPALADETPRRSNLNAAYRRYRLIHRFELTRHTTVDDGGDGGIRPVTDSEALALAVAATSPEFAGDTDGLQRQIDSDIASLAAMDSPTLLAVTDRIIDSFLSEDTRRRENVFITAFQDLVLDFSEEGENSVSAFLEWWDRSGSGCPVQSPDGLDAISIMTIHKAKGLEFKCVHVPYFSFDMVSYHRPPFRKSISWFKLDATQFPGIDPDIIPPMLPLPNLKDIIAQPAFATEGREWLTEQKTDTLNVAYVALTRAVNELCVYVDNFSGRGYDEADNIGECFHDALASLTPEMVAGLRVTDGGDRYLAPLAGSLCKAEGMEVFEFGGPTVAKREDEVAVAPLREQIARTGSEESEMDVEQLYAGALDQYFINERAEICASTDYEDLVNFNMENERHRGIFLHEVLSRVRTAPDLGRALAGSAYRYRITATERDECREILETALADPRVAGWFGGYQRMITERRVVDGSGVRRPDRVVWMPDGDVHVIDYKFGVRHDARYVRQVRRYMSLLSRAGNSRVRGFLWYPVEREIVEVS